MLDRNIVTCDGEIVSVRSSGLPDKAVLLAFCDEVSASSYLCLTRDEAIEVAAALVLLAESGGDGPSGV